MNNWTRKDFLKATLVGGSAALIAGPGRLYAQGAPAVGTRGSANGDARIAVVGLNKQGASHMKTYFNLAGTRLVALCDVDSEVLAKRAQECAAQNIKVTTYSDYRKLLADPNVDAIVIATPNHHHSLMTIWALDAGKDVYVEKPLSHNVWEGRQAVEAARKSTKNIVMAGTQNRSSLDIAEAIAYVRGGELGKIQWARGLCYKMRDSIGRTTGPQAVPTSINYDLWTGPAALTPPRRNSKANGTIHYDWHWFWNYGGGDITNQGIHQMDVARWFLGEPGLPPSVQSVGGRFGYLDDAETPNTLISVMNYEKAPLIFEVRGLPRKANERTADGKEVKAMDAYRSSRVGVVVQCEGGYVTVSESGTVVINDNDGKKLKTLANGGNDSHRPNFVKALQSRKVVNGLVEEAHYSSALCHLANVSYQLGAEKSDAAIVEAIKSSAVTKETYARMVDHLKANEVDVAKTPTILGPSLTIDAKQEMFTGTDKTLVAAANNHTYRKRVGRGEFTIPEIKGKMVAGA